MWSTRGTTNLNVCPLDRTGVFFLVCTRNHVRVHAQTHAHAISYTFSRTEIRVVSIVLWNLFGQPVDLDSKINSSCVDSNNRCRRHRYNRSSRWSPRFHIVVVVVVDDGSP